MAVRLRYWAADAKSGDVVGELRVKGSAKLVTRLGGGTCSVPVSLGHLTTRDGRGIDFGAVVHTLGLITPGKRSIVVTDHLRRVLGEWVIMRKPTASDDGTVAVHGMEWDGYPALRSLNDDFVHKTATSQLAIARALLVGAFTSFNTGMQITIPTVASSVTRTLERRAQTCYFSDALEEIAEPDDGFEWKVETSGIWSGGTLTKVTRSIVFGQPTLARASDVVFDMGPQGSRRGSALSIEGGEDFSRYAQSIYGIGSGAGKKQRKVGLSDPTLTNQGYLNSTKNVSFPNVTSIAELTKLTQAALTQAQDLRDPFSATAWLDRLADLPRVGTSARLRSALTLAYPVGLDQAARLGEVAYATSGHQCSLVTVKAI